MGSRISPMMASAMGRMSAGSQGATVGSQSRRSSRVNAVTWARFSPSISLLRAFSDRRVPWQAGQTDSQRNFATRAMPFSSFTFARAFFTVFTAL